MKKTLYVFLSSIFLFANANILYSAEETDTYSDFAVDKKYSSFVNAVLTDNIKTITEFINNGANLEQPVCEGMTVLMIAAERSSFETVKLLVEKGANVNAVNTYIRETSYIKNGDFDDKRFNFGYNAGTAYENIGMNRTVLMYALNNKDLKVVKFLLDKGADITVRDMYGEDILFYAVAKNNPRITELLIDRGANVNVKDNKGRTPLMYAIMQKRTQDYYNYGIITFLIEKGANVNETDNDGNTALTYAKKYSAHDVIKILSDNGAK